MIDEIELASLYAKKTKSLNPKKFKDETFELYSIRAFDNGYPEIITGAEIGSSKKVLEYNDVILSRIVPHIRRCWVVPKSDKLKQIGSGEWIVFRSEKICPDYLRYFLLSNPFHSMFMNTVKGVGGSLLRADPKQVGRFKIPLPSLKTQQYIAQILQDASALHDKTKQLIKEFDLLAQSIFLDMFGDPYYNTKNFKRLTIGAVTNIAGGSQPPKKVFKSELKEGYIRLVQIRDYKSDRFLTYVPKKSTRKFCTEEDIMIGRYGPPVFQILRGIPGAYNVALMKASPKEVIHNEYLFFLLLSSYVQGIIIGNSQRTAGQSGVNLKLLNKIEVNVPPIELQIQFAEKIDLIEKQKKLVKQELQESEDLLNCLLQKAFKGELV